ncbi:hypothetical protein JHK84_050802 [Glycine max]|nr:hypothetical protein JHK84_050802 [Glycine max]
MNALNLQWNNCIIKIPPRPPQSLSSSRTTKILPFYRQRSLDRSHKPSRTTDSDRDATVGVLDENDGVASDELLVVDKLAPAGAEEVATRCAVIDVAEVPLDAADVGDREELDRRIGTEVQRREARVGAEVQHGEAVVVVGIGGSEDLRERNDTVVHAVLIVIVISNLLGVVLEMLML